MIVKTNFLKQTISIIMAILLLLPLIGCGKKAPTYKDGQYFDADGKVMEDSEVTLDVISILHYDLKYDELTDSSQRKQVVTLYLQHHIPAVNETQINGKNTVIDLVSGFDPKLPPVYESRLDLADGVLTEASTILSLADIYAKFKDDAGFEQFVGKISKTCELADIVFKFSKACYIVSDLTNNKNLENKQEYCNDIIDALSLITSNVPVFDKYFTESLEVVKVGLQKLIENYDMRKKMYEIIKEEIDKDAQTIFSVNDTFALMCNWNFWESGPTIAQILQHPTKLKMLPAGAAYECFRDYILWRVPYELQGGKSGLPNQDCSHKWELTKIIKEATCSETGSKSMTCSICKATTVKDIEIIEHTYETKLVLPNAQKQGYTLHTCKYCNYWYADEWVDEVPVTVWYGEGKQEHSKNRSFKLTLSSFTEENISGYLEVFTVINKKTKYTHQTKFNGTGKKTTDGYEYLLKFDTSVTFGVVPAYTYDQLTIYYNNEKNTFTFKGIYQVTMTQQN